MKGCKHAGCPRPHSSHGFCSPHAAQWVRHGHTWEVGRGEPLELRIGRKVEAVGTCQVWRGNVMANGYGQISWNRRPWLVHRAVWTQLRGPIPAEMTIDHLCRNRACVNVDHMEVVTRGENSIRGGGLERTWSNRRAKTHCKHGHEYTPENTYVMKSGGRACRACQRRSSLDYVKRSGRRRPRQLKPCGTRAAYERHRQAGERCDECREANAATARAARVAYRPVKTMEVPDAS